MKHRRVTAIAALHQEESNHFGWKRCRECKKQFPCPTIEIVRAKK